ncbi:hypothetical protein CF54_04190 [Streptomyces sp. Tu 6176]|uniref:hypothetical protein n=1 Tax=Streptomyces sp. Tu 6176 TaxID=1470557 RepID=UPI000448C060|nr:hypothetical protein [Streptomyces sp. Tu 6176]EYT83977.1 hypothetical protein CF54_04190 [Streptomyces sp. Tu 6176]
MDLIEETYFGWDPLTHADDCPVPVWDTVEIRRSTGVRPAGPSTSDAHACTNPMCEHAAVFGRVQLRLLCRDCGTVRIISGEGLSEACTHTSLTGWGQHPTRTGGVWLWPGRPAIPGGAPHQYLVTQQPAALTRATLHGIITGYHDSTGRQRWIAAAVPDEDGAHHVSALRWRHSSPGLTTVAEAADWISALHIRPQRTLVVSV